MKPLIEEYRPNDIESIQYHKPQISMIKNMISDHFTPCFIFCGQSGIGKTSIALVLAKDMYGEYIHDNVLELNASHDRGVNVVRNKIQSFVDVKSLQHHYKMVILDEADAMTNDAQEALRLIIDNHKSNVIFIFICNVYVKIAKSLKSRSITVKFDAIPRVNIVQRCKYIIKHAHINCNDKALELIAEHSHGDMRYAINTIQSLNNIYANITSSNAEKWISVSSDRLIKRLYSGLLKEPSIHKRIELIHLFHTQNHLHVHDIMGGLIDRLSKCGTIDCNKIITLGDIEYTMSQNLNETIAIACIASMF